MVHLELSDEQSEQLGRILWSYLTDLRMEIADTDLKDYRDALKDREVFLKDVIRTLETKSAATV